MVWGRVIKAVSVAVVVGGTLIVGKVWGQTSERKAHEPMRKENENLRNERNQLISFFEQRTYQYEKIIAQLYSDRPANKAELRNLLQGHGLTDKEINRVHEILIKQNFYNRRSS